MALWPLIGALAAPPRNEQQPAAANWEQCTTKHATAARKAAPKLQIENCITLPAAHLRSDLDRGGFILACKPCNRTRTHPPPRPILQRAVLLRPGLRPPPEAPPGQARSHQSRMARASSSVRGKGSPAAAAASVLAASVALLSHYEHTLPQLLVFDLVRPGLNDRCHGHRARSNAFVQRACAAVHT